MVINNQTASAVTHFLWHTMLCILLALVESHFFVPHRRLYHALAYLDNSLHNHWSPESAWAPSTYSEGNISSSCHQWKTAGHTLCINMFVVNRISHHAMIIYTYPTFSTHLSRYLVSRLWLLSHGLSYINFSLLLHSLNTLSIEQNSSSGSAFQKTPATVFRFNRWSRQDIWKCTRENIPLKAKEM